MVENLSVSWDDYHKNICKGLGALQQRGEFVDMTIAADGHHVKVHQMVMSLVSPYIKELITSAQCPHPVVFLNKVSYQTMQAILEYAYTGEVMVSKERIGEFLQACKDLHIKGLDNMMKSAQNSLSNMFLGKMETEKYDKSKIQNKAMPVDTETFTIDDDNFFQNDDDDEDDDVRCNEDINASERDEERSMIVDKNLPHDEDSEQMENVTQKKAGTLQYAVSCQGNLQVVLNRYLYSLRHVRKNNQRFWRCTNQQATSCPAVLTTLPDNTIVERANLHNHAFHDKQILKRVRNGNMYTSLNDVESAAQCKKNKLHDADAVKKGLTQSYENS